MLLSITGLATTSKISFCGMPGPNILSNVKSYGFSVPATLTHNKRRMIVVAIQSDLFLSFLELIYF